MPPAEAAEALGVSPATLRRWSTAFASLLSQAAGQPGHGETRQYSEQDLAIFQQVKALLAERLTAAQALERLRTQAHERVSTESRERSQLHDVEPMSVDVDDDDSNWTRNSVQVIDQAPEVEQLRALLAAHQQTLEAQTQVIEQQRMLMQALERQVTQRDTEAERLRQQFADERQQAAQALERARADEAQALADLRHVISRIPRWLRSWLRIGV